MPRAFRICGLSVCACLHELRGPITLVTRFRASSCTSLRSRLCFCDSYDGCNGDQIDTPWDYIMSYGVVISGQYQGPGPFGSDFLLPHCHHHGPQDDDSYSDEGISGCPPAPSPQCPSSCDYTALSDHSPFGSDMHMFKDTLPRPVE